MAYSERELLARMIQCEAGGEGDNGMKAVAIKFITISTTGIYGNRNSYYRSQRYY